MVYARDGQEDSRDRRTILFTDYPLASVTQDRHLVFIITVSRRDDRQELKEEHTIVARRVVIQEQRNAAEDAV